MMKIGLLISVIACLFSSLSWAQFVSNPARKVEVSFNQKNKRPPGPYDLMAQMERIIPFMSAAYHVDMECLELNKETATVVGSIMPDYGQPLESEPDGLYVKLYARCMARVIDANLYNDSSVIMKNYTAILGASLLSEMVTTLPSSYTKSDPHTLSNVPWSSFSPELQARVMKRLVFYILGPESLLRYYKYIGSGNVFGQPLANLTDLVNFTQTRLTSDKDHQPNFLTIVKSMVIMFRLGPALTN